MSIYSTEEKAVNRLIKNKKPDCVDALEKLFWQGRKDGWEIREAYERSIIIHYLRDHDGLNTGQTLTLRDTPATTDEEVYAYIAFAMAKAEELGDTQEGARHLADIHRKWYDLFRSWGADIYNAYLGATRVTEEIWDEENDIPETEAIEQINKIPSTEIRERVLDRFQALREEGDIVLSAFQNARDEIQAELEQESLAKLFGGLFSDSNRGNLN